MLAFNCLNFFKVKCFQRSGFRCQPAPLHLGNMTGEQAGDALRDMDLPTACAAVANMPPAAAADAMMELPEERLVEALFHIDSDAAAPLLDELFNGSADGAKLAASAVAILVGR